MKEKILKLTKWGIFFILLTFDLILISTKNLSFLISLICTITAYPKISNIINSKVKNNYQFKEKILVCIIGLVLSISLTPSSPENVLINNLENEISELQEENTYLKTTQNNNDFQIEKESLNTQISTANTKINLLEEEKSTLTAQITELTEKNTIYEQQISSLETDKSNLSNQIVSLQQQISSLQQQVSSLENEKNSLTSQLSTKTQPTTSSSFSSTPSTSSTTTTNSEIVYVTKTGDKYHRDGCSYLRSKIQTNKSDAIAQGYTPCSRCNP